MSHPQEPTRQPTQAETKSYASTLHNMALASVVIGPILVLLPPRKIDVYTLSLTGLTVYSANHLYRESYGRSIWQRLSSSDEASIGSSLPTEQARKFQRQHRLQQEAQIRSGDKTALEAVKAKQNVLDKVWMGSETEGWNEKREREVQKKLDEGKGYGDIIMDQIWEVWNWGKTDENGGNGSGSESGK